MSPFAQMIARASQQQAQNALELYAASINTQSAEAGPLSVYHGIPPLYPRWPARDINGCETEFATPLHQENALLRERITTLEIEVARLNRELVAAQGTHASSEPLPRADCDRIFWDVLRAAANS